MFSKPHDRRPFSIPTLEALEERTLLSLLGVGAQIQPPDVNYDTTGTLVYDAAAHTFNSDAAPTSIIFSIGARPIAVQAPKDFWLRIQVDNSGRFLGGYSNDDLYVEGQVDVNRDGVVDYGGVLLTARAVGFGYLDSGTNDQYDFRLIPTGGSLMPLFEGKDIGLTMNSLNSTFAGDFSVSFGGRSQGVLGVIPAQWSSLSGRVFEDADNDGAGAGDAGISGVAVSLTGTDLTGAAVQRITSTAGDGTYSFGNLRPGTYTVTETQPAGYLDNVEGVNSRTTTLSSGSSVTGIDFGEIVPASLSGMAWVDSNDDGTLDFGEDSLPNVRINLTGSDDRGQAVSRQLTTDADGAYVFRDLRPGTYTVTEIQPGGWADGMDMIGTAGGMLGSDSVSKIVLGANVDGYDYNFAELPAAGAAVAHGQTATIGFWQNKNGQALISSLNGGASAKQLSTWLAASFPNMFGNLAGKTNAEIAKLYQSRFKDKGQKLDAQVMATAMAAYVTSSDLAGSAASRYGFNVTQYGVGISTYNVQTSGAAFGVANYSSLTVMRILEITDSRTVSGILYNGDKMLGDLANAVYDGINNCGDIA